MPELHDLLDRGVPAHVPNPDVDALLTRGRRRRRTKRVVGGAAAALALLVGGSGIASLVGGPALPFVDEGPAGDGDWERIEDAPITQRERPGTATDGDRVLLWGGESGQPHVATEQGGTLHSTVVLDDGAVWDPREGWTAIPPAPTLGLRGSPHVRLAGEAALVWGGVPLDAVGDGGVHRSGAWSDWFLDGAVHDLGTGAWRAIPPAPLATRRPAVVLWDGAELLVWGGEDADGAVHDDGARWTAATGWTVMADFPLSPRLGAATAWDNERLVVWGGGTNLDPEAGVEALVADGAVYDRAADAWTVLPDGPLGPRWFSVDEAGPTALLDGDRLLVAGGATTTPLTQHHDGAWLDLTAGAWAPIADAPGESRFVQTDAGGAYAIDDDGEQQGVWLYDTERDRWAPVRTTAVTDTSQATASGRLFFSDGASWPGVSGEWRPVTFVTADGAVRAPRLTPTDGEHRAFAAVVPTDDGVLLWGGMAMRPQPGGGWTGEGWSAAGWFLPEP